MIKNSLFRSGFTLVELMVAIVILGVLAAVAVVGYSKYTTNARLAEAHGGIDNLGKAQITYFLGAKRFINYQINPSGHTMYNPGFNKIKPHSDLGNDPAAGWQIGYPFTPGTEVWFTYSGAAECSSNSDIYGPWRI
jgi:prepilin-type N-terminal cleavage/methylation domain-containing protein